METYFSSFIPGLGKIVQEQLSHDLGQFNLIDLFDDLVIYSTSSAWQQIKDIKYLNNSFLLVHRVNDVSDLDVIRQIAEHVSKQPLPKLPVLGHTFRVMGSYANQPAAIPAEILTKIETNISHTTGMGLDRTSPDCEFLVLYRAEGIGLFGLRLTKHPDYKKILSKGQLRPELAHLLCLIAGVDSNDIILDPFAGSDAIAQARKQYPHRQVISGDIEPVNSSVKTLDALNMTSIPSETITRIVTDPPWGISVGQNLELKNFYSQMLSEFHRVIVAKGVAVILIGKKELFEEIINEFTDQFQLESKYDILVSGKKSAIYKLRKI